MRVDDNTKLADAELGWYFTKLEKLQLGNCRSHVIKKLEDV